MSYIDLSLSFLWVSHWGTMGLRPLSYLIGDKHICRDI